MMITNKDYYCVIMAGGTGSRFWPISTSKLPKQFHDILGTGRTLIQQTFDRISKIIPKENIYIITNVEYIALTLEQLTDISSDQVIGEPAMMNTAPCNLYMANKIYNLNPNASIIVASSDHLIINEDLFKNDILNAMDAASNNDILVTLGIKPTHPNTGYGYIEYDENNHTESLHKVKSFKEKPNYQTAEKFLERKNFLWNSGIFIWSAKSILSSFEKYLPDMFKAFSTISSYNTPQESIDIKRVYSEIQKISIDYGILEKSDNVWVIPSSFGWSDLGTWGVVYENYSKDDEGNVIHGTDIHAYNTKNTIIKNNQDNKVMIIDGLEDFIIVNTSDALLICPRNKSQEIKKYVEHIQEETEEKKQSK